MSMPRVFTIAPDADFTQQLAHGIFDDSQQKKIPLPDYLILLPTRRACVILREALREAAAGQALLLPRMQPIGDMNAEELTLSELGHAPGNIHDIPGAITPLARALELCNLLRSHDPALTADAAWLQAGGLAALLDQTQIERLDFKALRGLVREDLAEHWQKILDFLEVITVAWPRHLAERGLVDPATQRDALITRRVALWTAHPPQHPVIAAGSTGSMPATADLLAVIAGLPHGAVILPGLDQTSSPEIWDTITDPTHPQFLLKHLLQKIGCRRDQVKVWYGQPSNDSRAAMLHTAFDPPEGAAQWRMASIPETAWHGIDQYSCETLEEEAGTIALALRAALETPGKTAALVTRDRQLAARVTAQIQRWNIRIDDSAGQDLTTTPCGAFLLLILAAAQRDAGAVDLLALLQHPLTALRGDPALCRARGRLAERLLWRDRRLRGSVAVHAHAAAELARTGAIAPHDAQELVELFSGLEQALQPLAAHFDCAAPVSLATMLTAHMETAANLATTSDQDGALRLWRRDDGVAAAALLHELTQAAEAADSALTGHEYPSLLRQIFAEQVVRPRFGTHPRLSILGPLEARFVRADLVILGGMNEGSWPPASVTDPWLSRPMRQNFGLPAFERQIGQAAHDFVQLASRGHVIMTRSRRVGNAPTSPSRFLLRLDTLWAACSRHHVTPSPDFLAWARQLDAPATVTPMPAPRPSPAVARRPTHFSVTEIGRWRRNPYGFYAKHVLRLKPLGELDPDFSHAEHGTILHDVLHRFIEHHLNDFPPPTIALEELRDLGQAAFASMQDQPAIYATCRARFENSARWFITAESALRTTLRPALLETQGQLPIVVDGITYYLRGKPDRIDFGPDGLIISDYKTGSPPSDSQIRFGYEPQLPLLGMMAQQSAFSGLAARQVTALRYLHLKGRANATDTYKNTKEPQERIKEAQAMLEKMLRIFSDPAMPYLVCPQPRFIPDYDDYAHLGRIDEWGAPGEAA
ncbi:MAG: double-strand break repair protein AddB [Alphaproteobacteria bacterium]